MDFYSDFDYNNIDTSPSMYYDQYSFQNFPNVAMNRYTPPQKRRSSNNKQKERAQKLKQLQELREKCKRKRCIKFRSMMLSVVLLLVTVYSVSLIR